MIDAEAFLQQPVLPPMLLLQGDEPYYQQRVTEVVRSLARQADLERVVLEAGADADWAQLAERTREVGLFSRGELIELTLTGSGPGRAGSDFFRQWAARAPEGTVLFVRCGRVDQRQQKSAWVQAFEQAGQVVRAQAPWSRQLPAWCQRRAAERGLSLTPEAAALLAERTEGNLLAADQALEILRLRYGEGAWIDVPAVMDNVADQAHYDLFALSDRLLAGETAEALHVLARLQDEGEALQLVIWLLAREIRLLYRLAAGVQPVDQVFGSQVWKSKQPAYLAASRRHDAAGWAHLLARLAEADQQLKGLRPGSGGRTLAQIIVQTTRLGAEECVM